MGFEPDEATILLILDMSDRWDDKKWVSEVDISIEAGLSMSDVKSVEIWFCELVNAGFVTLESKFGSNLNCRVINWGKYLDEYRGLVDSVLYDLEKLSKKGVLE